MIGLRLGQMANWWFGARAAFVKLCRVEGPIGLWLGRRADRLPCFALPLRSGDESVPIDLNVLMQRVYESAALDLAIARS
jgi:hypothetical protein